MVMFMVNQMVKFEMKWASVRACSGNGPTPWSSTLSEAINQAHALPYQVAGAAAASRAPDRSS